MKKIIIGIVSLSLIAANAKAQAVLDTTMLICNYKYMYVTDTLQHTRKDDMMILAIGRNICKFYSETNRLYDSAVKVQMQKIITESGNRIHINSDNIPQIKRSEVKAVMYFNYPKGKITTFDRILFVYEYEEDIENINWQFIHDESKEILGYTCKKATCRFRGRDYEAWYTPDIPINLGVWKFSGLPGLILRVSDSQEQVQFVCESVEKLSVPIIKDNEIYGNAVKISRKEYLKIERDFYGNPMSVMGQFSTGTIKDANGNPLPPPTKSLPYNPIELE
ncbi:MAG: GLPGLI family protein [Prevotellaceae bacterium]|jgi:GLPGLI family protein|nr:GLPGLI family protein [Prevotellaceae bacterium]